MRARPLAGRVLQSDDFEPGAGKVVVLSQNLWNRRFGGRQEVMGDTVLLSDVPYTVVGIFDAKCHVSVDARDVDTVRRGTSAAG